MKKRFDTRSKGFTLVELAITLAVIAILTTVALPAMQGFTIRSRLVGINNELLSALNLARSEAVKRGMNVTLCKSNNGSGCGGNWSDGWIVFADSGTVGDATGDTVIRVNQALPQNYTLAATANFTNYVSYRRDGSANNIGTFVVCHSSDESTARGVTLTRLRPRVARDTDSNGIPDTDSGNITSCEAP